MFQHPSMNTSGKDLLSFGSLRQRKPLAQTEHAQRKSIASLNFGTTSGGFGCKADVVELVVPRAVGMSQV